MDQIEGVLVLHVFCRPEFEALQRGGTFRSRFDNLLKDGSDLVRLVISEPSAILEAQDVQVWTERHKLIQAELRRVTELLSCPTV